MVVSACDVGGVEKLEPPETGGSAASFLGEIDAVFYCDDRVGIVDVVMRARALDCERGDCVLVDPPIEFTGDQFNCPASEPYPLLRVEVSRPGSYFIDAVPNDLERDTPPECFVDGNGPVITVEASDIDESLAVRLTATMRPCTDD